MIIHKSHSKKELINIIKSYNIKIKYPQQYKKIELSALLVDALKHMDNIVPCDDLPFLCIIDLKLYLTKLNPKKQLSIKDKSKVILTTKRIKHFCRNGYNIDITDYQNINDLYEDALMISHYGDIPSVRKCISELNKYPNKIQDINCIISPYTQKELDLKKKLRQQRIYKCEIKQGHFVVRFD